MQEGITSLRRTRVIGNSGDSSAKGVSGHRGNISAEGVQPEASGLPSVSVDLNPEVIALDHVTLGRGARAEAPATGATGRAVVEAEVVFSTSR